jgi:hypothetical protein
MAHHADPQADPAHWAQLDHDSVELVRRARGYLDEIAPLLPAAERDRATGIVGYHAYLPAYRLRRGEIAAAIGASARGVRCVAYYDEDSTTLAVAAALPVVRGGSRPPTCGSPPPT